MLKQNILHSLGESRVKNETKDKGTPDGKTLKPKTACRKTESQSEHPFKMGNWEGLSVIKIFIPLGRNS